MENEEKQETLEERFERIEKEQKEHIEKLQNQINEHDELIKKYMTTPSNIQVESEEDEAEPYTRKDVEDVLKIIKNKRS